MARLLGEARVAILADGAQLKPSAEAAVKKGMEGVTAKIPLEIKDPGLRAKIEAATEAATKGITGKVKIEADTKGLDTLRSKIDAFSKSLGNMKIGDPNAQAFLSGITKQAEALKTSLDNVGDSKGLANANAQLERMIATSDKIRAALGKTTFATEMENAAKAAADAQIKESERAQRIMEDNARRLSADFEKIRVSLDTAGAERQGVDLREKLNLILSGIKAKVTVDKNSLSSAGNSVRGFLGGIGKDSAQSGIDNGGKFGKGFIGGLAKSALFQNPGITAAVIAGLAALPAAVGVIGVLGGIALGAGLMYGAEKLIKAQLKTLTTDIKNNTTILNAKSSTPAVKQAAQQAIASDQAQVTALNNELAAFNRVNIAVKNLKQSFLIFAITASKPLIKPFADALDMLSAQLKGPLANSFSSLFKAVGPLVKPVEEALLEIVNGILPGMTSMLNKARGPLANLFIGFGKIVGVKIGDWFRAATPYIAASSKYFLTLVKALGSTVTWLIKFGGESAKAFAGSQFQGFGKLIQQIANDLLKIVIPAFEGWTGVMAPVAKDLLLILTPLLNFLAANPGLVKALAAMAAAWLLVGKAVEFSAIAMKVFGVSTEAILVAAPWIALAAAIVLAAILIIKYWKPISSFFVKTWKEIWSGAIGPMINFFTNSVPHAAGVTLNWLKKNWPLIVSIVGGPIGAIAVQVVSHWNTIFNFMKGITGRIENVVTGAFKPMASVAESVWNEIYKVVKSAVTLIANIVKIQILIVVGLVGQAWRGIKNLTGLVWPWMYNTIKDAWGHIENVTTGVVKPMVSFVVGAWNVLKNATGAVYSWIFNEIKSVWGHVENITTGIVKPMVTWVESAWNVLKAATRAAYDWIFNTIKAAWGHIENVTVGIVKPMVNWVEGAWAVLKNNTRAAFNWIHDAIINPLQKAYNWVVHNFVVGIKSAFGGLVSAVKSIWNGLKAAVGNPINFVIGIWNKFAGFVDKGLSIFGIKTRLPMGNPIKFAKGGKVPGFAPGVDIVPAMLSPGEFVLTPEATAAIGADKLHSLNKSARTGGRNGGRGAFANGGDVVNDIEKWNGHRYVWGGGANPSTGWDCSSFVNYIVGHDFKLNLPGGGSWAQMTNNGASHGPVAAAYNNWNYGRGVPWSGAKMGDLAIENNGAHIGFIIQDNTSKSSNATLQGFAARSTATGTGYEQFFPSAFHLERFADDRGFISQVWDNTGGAVLKAAASVALNGIEALVNGAMNHIPGTGPIPQLAKVTVDDVINAAKSKLEGNQNNYQFNNPAATGPAGSGTSSGEMANGKQLYNYLLKYLFGGNKIAAAGAAASIWGESAWNPFAQGTGGRGLIGWTPPSTISNADFNGGMSTQLPAILRFVTSSGDSGVIAEMFRATSVLQAANEWGKGVERYGINDVHSTGIQLASSFMRNGGMIPSHVFDRGGTLAPGPNMVYNLTGKREHLTPTNGGAGSAVTLEVTGGGESEFEQFMLMAIRKWVRIKGGRGEGSVQRAFGRN